MVRVGSCSRKMMIKLMATLFLGVWMMSYQSVSASLPSVAVEGSVGLSGKVTINVGDDEDKDTPLITTDAVNVDVPANVGDKNNTNVPIITASADGVGANVGAKRFCYKRGSNCRVNGMVCCGTSKCKVTGYRRLVRRVRAPGLGRVTRVRVPGRGAPIRRCV